MDTGRIKQFAIESRKILKEGVMQRIRALGFDEQGHTPDVPEKVQGGTRYQGRMIENERFYDSWIALNNHIQKLGKNGVRQVYEEAAYTWFNRLIAIRIMQKNHFIEPVLSYDDPDIRVPHIVSEARRGRLMTAMTNDEQQRLRNLLMDDTKTQEQFALLIIAYCRENKVISKCFGGIAPYLELLLPDDILSQNRFIDLLNNTSDYITDEQFQSAELIGWLYQFYISEKKDFIINSGKKAEIDDIPARTQLFTPNWIVKYMVQNTIGRIYLDNNPYERRLQKNWQYFIDSNEKTPKEDVLNYSDLNELKIGDLACGSGHILNEEFDILYDMYLVEGYSRKDAIENIFRYNLVGVDIDTRARQLAQFALLLKACQKDSSFADAHQMPQIYDMPEPYPNKDNLYSSLSHFFIGGNQQMILEVIDAINLMDQAKNLGSIMKFNISDSTRNAIAVRVKEYEKQTPFSDEVEQLIVYMRIILILTAKYSALVMNPPYMGSSYMNDEMKQYIIENYPNGKSDLFSVFMYQSNSLLKKNGYIGYICPYVWMFISSYEKFRDDLLNDFNINSLIQLEYNAFEPACVPICTFTLSKTQTKSPGSYIKLSSFKGHQNQAPRTLEAIKNRDCGWFFKTKQDKYQYIPGAPIGYWLTDRMFNAFKHTPIKQFGKTTKGIITGDNAQFIRNWYEVSFSLILFTATNSTEASISGYKWFPCNKGGGMRKWYGNNECIIDWENDGLRVLQNAKREKRHSQDYFSYMKFRPIISWSSITSNTTTFRYKSNDLVEHAGMGCYIKDEKSIYSFLGFFSSKVTAAFLEIISPTLNINAGEIESLPFNREILNHTIISSLVEKCVRTSKHDWDAHETSWDFEENPLLHCNDVEIQEEGETADLGVASGSLQAQYDHYKAEWTQAFKQLHSNEEELNRQFIEIYGLQDELTPDVPLDEITILQQGEISIENNDIKWHADVVMKQLISYAIGCMMGRYRLDKKGLSIAHPNPDESEYAPYQYHGETFEIDEDGIIPLMPKDSRFDDNAVNRLTDFIKIVFGVDKLTENMNFLEESLEKTIEQYLTKDFWKDHKKMYQNRPIYWLFSSKKGDFQVIAYMHRMNKYTAETIRNKYLLPYIDTLRQELGELDGRISALTNQERKQYQKLQKDLEECMEYHDRLHMVADQQIAFDLDDGVVVNYAKFGDVLAKLK